MIFHSLSMFISTVCFIGYIPFAPGTFGTLAAFVFMILIKPDVQLHIAAAMFFIVTGIVSSNHAEKILGKKDPGHVVIDEFTGYIISLLFLPITWAYMTSAFVLFRFFDIIKPPPLRRLQNDLKGGLGIMADDIGAGIYANLVLQAWRFLSRS